MIEWHAQNLQYEADERLPTETMSDEEDEEDDEKTERMELKTPRSSSVSSSVMFEDTALPSLVAEVVSNMPTLMRDLLKPPNVPDLKFANGDQRKPFGLVRLQAVELFTHMVYVRHPIVATCMKELRVILTCLELCFEYELNNTVCWFGKKEREEEREKEEMIFWLCFFLFGLYHPPMFTSHLDSLFFSFFFLLILQNQTTAAWFGGTSNRSNV